MKIDEYECAVCHEILKKGWSEEEASAEAEKFFGKPPKDWECEAMMVCDDCFNNMHPDDNPEALATGRASV